MYVFLLFIERSTYIYRRYVNIHPSGTDTYVKSYYVCLMRKQCRLSDGRTWDAEKYECTLCGAAPLDGGSGTRMYKTIK